MSDVQFVFDKNGYMDAIVRGAYFGLVQLGIQLQGEVRNELSQPGTGRHHTSWGLRYRSSAPGKPPAVQSGRLRNSWLAGATPKVSNNAMTVKVSTKLPYAAILQYGGMTGRGRRTKIAPRPYLNRPLATVSDLAPEVITDKIAQRFAAINARGG